MLILDKQYSVTHQLVCGIDRFFKIDLEHLHLHPIFNEYRVSEVLLLLYRILGHLLLLRKSDKPSPLSIMRDQDELSSSSQPLTSILYLLVRYRHSSTLRYSSAIQHRLSQQHHSTASFVSSISLACPFGWAATS